MLGSQRRVYRWDPYNEPEKGDMEFRLTYAGQLLAARDDAPVYRRSPHVHALRRHFHSQLRKIWSEHPTLLQISSNAHRLSDGDIMYQVLKHDGFNWLPIVGRGGGLICKLDILMLRSGPPGRTLYDIDNRLKTLFDALRKAHNADELGARLGPQILPQPGEDPFYVLLEDDSLITHVAVSSDTLLEPVDNVPYQEAVRLVINVTVRPYHVHSENLEYS